MGIVINQNAQQAALLDEIRRTTLARHGAAAGKALARQDKDRALAQYEVELDSCEPEPFARGGQGTVHRAEFQGDVVALKRVSLVGSAAAARAKLLKAFATELAIMVKLRSPRVVQVLGVVTTDPTWLGFVVEYMAGGTLRARLDETRAEIGEGAVVAADEAQKRRWLGDVALGMQYLYARGVEHRDLKTLNVLLDEARRRCKVTDFGLSKSNDLNTAATTMATQQGGGAKGTPAYMAPELLGANTFTEKTDVYAFAILIWEVLDGGVPWPGINPMQARAPRPAFLATIARLFPPLADRHEGARPEGAAARARRRAAGPRRFDGAVLGGRPGRAADVRRLPFLARGAGRVLAPGVVRRPRAPGVPRVRRAGPGDAPGVPRVRRAGAAFAVAVARVPRAAGGRGRAGAAVAVAVAGGAPRDARRAPRDARRAAADGRADAGSRRRAAAAHGRGAAGLRARDGVPHRGAGRDDGPGRHPRGRPAGEPIPRPVLEE